MKSLLSVLVVGAVMGAQAYAYEPVPAPAPDGHADGGAVALYHCVKVEDPDHIAPCAVPLIVQVADPCASKDPCNCCAPPACVNVEICVPPCGCPKIWCSKDGRRVHYNYGRYRIQITAKRSGYVKVDYDN